MLGLVSAGLGLLVEAVSGRRLPLTFTIPLGFGALIAVGGLTTLSPAIAGLTTPVVVALALAGFVLAWPWHGRGGRGPWPWLAAVGVFFVFGLPVVFSGEATFTGYIKLDDTATWLAFTDHVLEYGRSVEGLAPSSHEATVQINLTAGYPLGAFIPLAVGSELTGTDPAWLFQPFLAFMAALMALSFFELAGRVIEDGRVRAALVFVAAQPALLVGFAWWGGIKEVATAQILALLAISVVGLAERPSKSRSGDLRAVLPAPVVAGSALIGVMGFGGMPWLLAFALGVIALMAWRARVELKARDFGSGGVLTAYLTRVGLVALGLVVIAVPTMFASGSFFSPNQEGLTSGEEMGNLITALNPAQYVGPWPVADFRFAPESTFLTVLLVAAAVVAFAFGIWAAIEKRAAGLLILTGGTGLGSLVIWLAGSPWVQGKALATGTASFLLLAMVGIATLITSPGTFDFTRLASGVAGTGEDLARRVRIAGLVLLIVPLGVFASNAMAFGDVWIAPRDQLAELEQIGEEFEGQGPALMTEYNPNAVRHLLRGLDAEGASELRRRTVPLTDGSTVDKGAWVDTDQLETDPGAQGLFTYPTLILRRSPQQSRPPTPYQFVRAGRFYEVWQLEAGFDPATLVGRVAAGEGIDPGGTVPCEGIRKLADDAGPDGRLIGSTRAPVAVATFDSAPPDWSLDTSTGTFAPGSPGTASGQVELPTAGKWIAFLGGSTRGTVRVSVDGAEVGSDSAEINNGGQYIEIGPVSLGAGSHEVSVVYERGSFLSPGTRTTPGFPLGPLVFADATAPDRLIEVDPADYRSLCDRRLDWVEAYSD